MWVIVGFTLTDVRSCCYLRARSLKSLAAQTVKAFEVYEADFVSIRYIREV